MTFYRSSTTRLWYLNPEAAGDIDAVKVNGVVRELDEHLRG
jgi:hypothetical protein